VNQGERATFDGMISVLNGALQRFGQPPVSKNSGFSIDPGWFPEILHVHVVKDGAVPLEFIPESGGWVRVDVAGLPEVLELPLREVRSFWLRRKYPTFADALPRLLTSSATVFSGGTDRLSLTDADGVVWHRYSHRPGHSSGSKQEISYDAICV